MCGVNSVVVYATCLVWCFSVLCTCGIFGGCWIGSVVWVGFGLLTIAFADLVFVVC